MQDALITPTPRFTHWLNENIALEFRFRRSIAIGAALSILFHILLLIFMPERQKKIENEDAASSQPLVVQLNPAQARPPPAAAPAPLTPPTPTPPATAPKPRVLAVPNPISKSPMAPVPIEPPPPPVIPPKPVDPRTEPPSMMARVEEARARRQALEDAAKSENAESRSNGSDPSAADRTAGNINRNLANLGRARDGTSGVFQIISKGYRTGSFSFRGWTTNRSDSYRRVIEVDAGQGGDIERAMVRRMIELIREHYQANFQWDSHRLGRVVTLSARKEDSTGLEDFLLSEFSEFNPPTARGAPPSSPPPPRRN
jgi:outer membrane biosynthesis protein TonB